MTNIYKRIPLTKEGVARYRERIDTASASPSLNGWEMDFLGDMFFRFDGADDGVWLSPKQWARLESVLMDHV